MEPSINRILTRVFIWQNSHPYKEKGLSLGIHPKCVPGGGGARRDSVTPRVTKKSK